ncbi:AraC family ligand binding domain-containing protein [Serratia ureilytica]
MQGYRNSFRSRRIARSSAICRICRRRTSIRAHIERAMPSSRIPIDASRYRHRRHRAERFRHRAAQHSGGAGALVLMNPDEPHTGEAETPGGWCYRMFYLALEALEQLSGDRSQWFTDAVRHDPRAAQCLSAISATLCANRSAYAGRSLLEAVELLHPHIRTAREKAEARTASRW